MKAIRNLPGTGLVSKVANTVHPGALVCLLKDPPTLEARPRDDGATALVPLCSGGEQKQPQASPWEYLSRNRIAGHNGTIARVSA